MYNHYSFIKANLICYILILVIIPFHRTYSQLNVSFMETNFKPSILPAKFKSKAKNYFKKGFSYFIWLDNEKSIISKKGDWVIEIPFRFTPKVKSEKYTFKIEYVLEYKTAEGKIYESKGVSFAGSSSKERKDPKLVFCSVILLGSTADAIEPSGKSKLKIFLTDITDKKDIKISNEIEADILIE